MRGADAWKRLLVISEEREVMSGSAAFRESGHIWFDNLTNQQRIYAVQG